MKIFFLRLKDIYGGNWLFLGLIILLYLGISIFDNIFFINVGKDFLNVLFNQILVVLIIVFVFMFILNILLQKDTVKNKIKNASNSTKYLFSIIGGVFSTGPVYMWYPFLKQLNNNGLNYGHISSFIYARAVKIPFLAVMIFYFGLKYTIIFNIVLIALALVVGVLVNLIFNFLDYEKNNS